MNNEKVSIQELVDLIAQQAGSTKKKAEDFLKIFQSTLEDGLIKDGLVKIKGFGTFKLIWNEARKSVNVQTGEEYIIPGHNKVTFTPEATIKELINNPNKVQVVSQEKQGIDPIVKLNEQAEEIKGIISEIKDLDKAEETKPEPVVEVKVEPVIVPTVEPIVQEEKPVEFKYPHESIQHAALSEKHVLHERDIPVKPKRKVGKIIVFSLLALLILGGASFYVEFKDTLVPEYKSKIVSKVKAIYADLTTKEKEVEAPVVKEKPVVKEQAPAPIDTVITVENLQKETPEVVETPKPEPAKVAPTVTKPSVSVFDEVRTYKTTLATETMEKGSRLVLLAEKHYGHKDFWVYIYEANKDVMKTPGAISIGMKIKVPKLNAALIDVNNPACLKYAKSLEEKYLK